MIAAILLCLAPIAYDGDTIACQSGERVRIFGIQSPEKGQPGDPEATRSLQQLVRGGVQCIHMGESYSRVVGLCMNQRKQDVGEMQIRRGHAHEWCKYSRGQYREC